MTLSIVDFLNARLTEDQAAAEAAGERSTEWAVNGVWQLEGVEHDVVGEEEAFCHPHNREHIARHDPARVLREVAAKRAVIELHGRSHECSTYDHNGDVDHCSWCLDPEECSTLLALAVVYSDHPAYQEQWKP